MPGLTLSVIIPVLNEAAVLPHLLTQLHSQRDVTLDILVVDGGSTDDSVKVAMKHQVRPVHSEKGRAKQLNHGARLAKYDQLLFLHADSSIDDPILFANALRSWSSHRSQANNPDIAGHFRLTFARVDGRNARAFRFLEEKSASNRPQTINGDQGLLIDRDFFDRLGGFDESLPFMEDQRLARAIFEHGEWILLPGRLTTSARRFEVEGFHRRYILMGMMMAFHWTGTYEFFDRAKDLYPQHKDSQKLRLRPYFKAVWRVLIEDLGFRGSLRLSYKMGRYLRQNSWQLFFFLDVSFQTALRGRRAFTRFHDRFIQPWIDNKVADLLCIPFVIVWYLLVLGPVFYFLDKKQAPLSSPENSQAK